MQSPPKGMIRAVIRDAANQRWISFEDPVSVISASTMDEVLPAIAALEGRGRGLAAAGFIPYDAAPAFDPAFVAKQSGNLPLTWFGLFRTAKVIDVTPSDRPAGPPEQLWRAEMERTGYESALATIRRHLYEGDSYQVNFSFRLHSTILSDPFEYFRTLIGARPASYAAFLQTDDWAICSISPELFFALEGDAIRCQPMKGTERRGRWYEEDVRFGEGLRQSTKNQAENVMIVDMVRNDLGRVARPGTVSVDRLFEIERLPGVWQMTSTVSARADASLATLFRALFPCASITGAPKPRTMEIISSTEHSARGVYTGTIGFVMPDDRAQFNVAIRTVVIDRTSGEAEYGTGGGIIWDSTTEHEYEECLLKARTLVPPPPAFTLFETMLWEPGAGVALLGGHLRRLCQSSLYHGFAYDERPVLQRLEAVFAQLPAVPHRIRLDLARDGGVSIRYAVLDLATVPVRMRLRRSPLPVDSADVSLYHKTSRRSVYDERRSGVRDCDDILLWNERGEVTETTIGNILLERDGEVVTPPLDSGLLPGVYRDSLLRAGKVREAFIRIEELRGCTGLSVCNALRGIVPAMLLDP